MHTVVYADADNSIQEKKFETLEEARAFCVENSMKHVGVPGRVLEEAPRLKKTRIEEIDSLIKEIGKSWTTQDLIVHEMLLALEIEKHDILMRLGKKC